MVTGEKDVGVGREREMTEKRRGGGNVSANFPASSLHPQSPNLLLGTCVRTQEPSFLSRNIGFAQATSVSSFPSQSCKYQRAGSTTSLLLRPESQLPLLRPVLLTTPLSVKYYKMDSPNLTQSSNTDAGLKRKRTPDDVGRPRPGVGNVTQINYLVKSRAERLQLIDGGADTFGEVLGMIDDYEG